MSKPYNYTMEDCEELAKRRGLIFEKIGRPYTCEKITYRYEITDNSCGVSEDCSTLAEAYASMYYWGHSTSV